MPPSPATAAAEAAATLGTTEAKLAYQLTTKALDQPEAVFPLLALELTAIAAGFTAYAATAPAAELANRQAQAALQAGVAYWQ